MDGQLRLENLLRSGALKVEPHDAQECAGLMRSATARLADARIPRLSFASRFDLAHNAAHGLALCALRLRGYRSQQRYLVFQCLELTAGLSRLQVRLFALCHERRNLAEYEGYMEEDEALFDELLANTQHLLQQVMARL
ncbi:hypothetical protein J4P02_04715 [Pseudomonas sp. NFXW11]|uniref:hypothetical protein n=1 Tax=Pseudomonas sp. NFXW11 TaxID=2819531 RepID=UPI003CF9DA84